MHAFARNEGGGRWWLREEARTAAADGVATQLREHRRDEAADAAQGSRFEARRASAARGVDPARVVGPGRVDSRGARAAARRAAVRASGRRPSARHPRDVGVCDVTSRSGPIARTLYAMTFLSEAEREQIAEHAEWVANVARRGPAPPPRPTPMLDAWIRDGTLPPARVVSSPTAARTANAGPSPTISDASAEASPVLTDDTPRTSGR